MGGTIPEENDDISPKDAQKLFLGFPKKEKKIILIKQVIKNVANIISDLPTKFYEIKSSFGPFIKKFVLESKWSLLGDIDIKIRKFS